MASTFAVVDPNSLSTTLFDMNGSYTDPASGATVTTAILHDPDFGVPALDARREFDSEADVGVVSPPRRSLAECRIRVRMHATSADILRRTVETLANFLAGGCVMKWVPDGSSETRYIDVEPSVTPALIDGRELAMYEVTQLFDTPYGVPLVFNRHPFMRSDRLNPATNQLVNPTMLRDSNQDGKPDSWADVGNTYTGTIVAAEECFEIAATSSGNHVQQDVTASAAQAWTFTCEARKVSGGGTPEIVISVVVFPAPLAPRRVTISRSSTRR